MYPFFPRDSRKVKIVIASFTWHPVRERYCIPFHFLLVFLSNLLNSVLNFDIHMQLLGAIFWTFLWKFIHGFLVHNRSDIWCSTRMYTLLSKNSRNFDACRNFTTLAVLGFVERIVLYLSKARPKHFSNFGATVTQQVLVFKVNWHSS
jgi:hypothetical protein